VPPTTDVTGYINNVLDGHTFDLQADSGARSITRLTLGNITVPDIGTCEGTAARDLLASIIFGPKVRIDADGVLWKDDIDVAKTMVAYGYATSGAYPAVAPPFSCAATTTTTIRVIQVPKPTTKPKPKPKPRPKATTPPPAETPAPEPAAPPASG
jgi:hypothetical protein